MKTIQDKIRKELLGKGNNDISNLDVNLSIPSSFFIYDFIKSDFFNKKYDCYLELNDINNKKYLSLSFYSLLNKKPFKKNINIFLDEEGNNNQMLKTEDSYIDGEYLTENEYNKAVKELNETTKYPKELLKLNKNFLFSEKECNELLKIKKLINNLHNENTKKDLYKEIEGNNLKKNYIFLSQVLKIPTLSDLSYGRSLFKESNLKEIKEVVENFNPINSQDKINKLREEYKTKYSLLTEKIKEVSNFFTGNDTEKLLSIKKNNHITIYRGNRENFEDLLKSERVSFSHSYGYLEEADLGLIKLDLNQLKTDSIVIYAKNENNEIAGALALVKNNDFTESNSFIDLNTYVIKSISTNQKFRGQNISSKLYKEALEMAENNNFAILRGSPTEDNTNYIFEKLNSISKEHGNLLIVSDEDDSFNYLKTQIKNKKINIKTIKEFKEIHDNLKKIIEKNDIENSFLTLRKNTHIQNFINNLQPSKSKKYKQ